MRVGLVGSEMCIRDRLRGDKECRNQFWQSLEEVPESDARNVGSSLTHAPTHPYTDTCIFVFFIYIFLLFYFNLYLLLFMKLTNTMKIPENLV